MSVTRHQYGLLRSPTPFDMAQKLYHMRISRNLPCIDGEVSFETLKQPLVRRAVCAYFYSLINMKILLEPVHFGCINHPQYKVIALAMTQGQYKFEPYCDYTWVDNKIVISEDIQIDMKSLIQPPLFVVTQDDRIIESHIVPIMASEESVSIVCSRTVGVRMPRGFNVVSVEVPGNEVRILERTITEVIVTEKDQQIMIIAEPRDVIFPLKDKVSTVVDSAYRVRLVGGEFRGGHTEEKWDSDTDCYQQWCFKAVLPIVIVSIDYYWEGYIDREYVKVEALEERSLYLEKKSSDFFKEIYHDLSLLPERTRLVEHNMNALNRYEMGVLMPSVMLLNQSVCMVGKYWMCTPGYDWQEERWYPYRLFEDWMPWVRKFYKRKGVLRTVLSLFEGYEYWYRGFAYFEPSKSVFREFDGDKHVLIDEYFDYSDYIKLLRVNFSRVFTMNREFDWNPLSEPRELFLDNDIELEVRREGGTQSESDGYYEEFSRAFEGPEGDNDDLYQRHRERDSNYSSSED